MSPVCCAVVGSPIAHSRSPVLHRAAYTALGLADWTYGRVDLRAADFSGWLSGLDDCWRGLSVTMPLKRAALAGADTASDLAKNLGAANTLLRDRNGWHADNTDVAGLLGAVRESEAGRENPAEAPVGNSRATIIGAGGTASAAVAALAALGYDRVDVVVRDRARAQGLIALAERLGMTSRLHPWPGEVSGNGALAADLVISTVPASATADLLDRAWHDGQLVVDVTYDPWPTRLVEAAARRGARAVGGASVLLWQAVAQVELMTGQQAPVETMRAALLPGGTLAPA